MQLLDYLHLASLVVSVAAAIAAVTPSPADDSALAKVRQVLDILAFNWGHASNAPKAQPEPGTDRS